MIVRILGEGQFEVPDDRLAGLNRFDEALVTAVETGDDDAFRTALAEMLAGVHASGTAVAIDSLEPSDLVLPGPDSTLQEVRGLLGDEGLIPG